MKYGQVVFSAFCLATRLSAQQPDIGPAPGTLVDVGGHKLHLLCSGAGAPTVVLEAGASSFAIDWTLVQLEVARTNRVCSYDRAGSGWSDPSTPSIGASVARDLHSLLQAAGEHAPYVMVGASLGGIFVRLYQADYPDQVAGIVLVDPASDDRLFTFFNAQPVTIASLTAEQYRSRFHNDQSRFPAGARRRERLLTSCRPPCTICGSSSTQGSSRPSQTRYRPKWSLHPVKQSERGSRDCWTCDPGRSTHLATFRLWCSPAVSSRARSRS